MIALLLSTAAAVIKSRRSLILENLTLRHQIGVLRRSVKQPVLFVFVILGNYRRDILHLNVTDSPTAVWAGQQMREAFPWDTTPLGLAKDCPYPRCVEPPHLGMVCAEPMVGGLHHRYFRNAA
jgi:hypothetical protein